MCPGIPTQSSPQTPQHHQWVDRAGSTHAAMTTGGYHEQEGVHCAACAGAGEEPTGHLALRASCATQLLQRD